MVLNYKLFKSLALFWLFTSLAGERVGRKRPVFSEMVSASPFIRSPWSKETNPSGKCGGQWGCKAVKSQYCPIQPDAASSAASIYGCGLSWGTQLSPLLLFPPWNGELWPLASVSPVPPPDPGISHSVSSQGKSVSVVPVLEFADNVVCDWTYRMRRGELWKIRGRWPSSVALFLCLKCWLSDNCGYTFVLHPFPGYWAQPQLVLSTPGGMPTKSLFSFHWKKKVLFPTWFLPSLGWEPI